MPAGPNSRLNRNVQLLKSTPARDNRGVVETFEVEAFELPLQLVAALPDRQGGSRLIP